MQAPFKPGQKVVYVNDNPTGGGFKSPSGWHLVKNKIYTVYWCGKGVDKNNNLTICVSLAEDPDRDEYCFDYHKFAPIEEQKERIRYVAVSESLREKAVEIAAIETN